MYYLLIFILVCYCNNIFFLNLLVKYLLKCGLFYYIKFYVIGCFMWVLWFFGKVSKVIFICDVIYGRK